MTHPTDGKTLILVRHAKSSWKDASLADIDRPLNKRGRRNAPVMGRWLHEQGPGPDAVISSPANRALSTAQTIARELSFESEQIVIDEDLYFVGTDGMLRALERVDDRLGRVMMVGHNPVMTRLLNQLTGSDVWNMPTCAIAIIHFAMESWGLVDSTRGSLVAYQEPKSLETF
ncbi:MAG: histidine phosphatase family protein [Pseudomonadota bacterium]